MPVVWMLRRVASRMLQRPACGCQAPVLPSRFLGTSPQQIPADANYHSTSFSEADQPRVLITGWVFFFFPHLWLCYFLCVPVYLLLECLTCRQVTLINQKLPFPLLAPSEIAQVPCPYFAAVARAWFPCPNLLLSEGRIWEPEEAQKAAVRLSSPFLRGRAWEPRCVDRTWPLESGASFLGQASQARQFLHMCMEETARACPGPEERLTVTS